jgi:Mrp family chromosome partitioning ATPase
LDVIGSDAAAAIFKDICSIYDYVILDLPPLTPAADARAAAQLLDGIVLVVESGRRVPEEVSLSLLSAGPVQDKLLGAVLNKVDRATLKQHHYP